MDNLLYVAILLCPVTVAPEACDPKTAFDIILGPLANTEIACTREGHAYLARTALIPTGVTYPKVTCQRNPASSIAQVQ